MEQPGDHINEEGEVPPISGSNSPTGTPVALLQRLTEVFRAGADLRFEAILPPFAAAIAPGLGDRCLVWQIAPGGSRMRLGAPETDDRAWRPTTGPVAQVLAAQRTIEMGIVEELLEHDELSGRAFTESNPIRAFGRFVPVVSNGLIIAVVAVIRAPGRELFTETDRALLEAATERLETAYRLSIVLEEISSRRSVGVSHTNGVVLGNDLLERLGAISGDVVFRHLFRSGTEYVSSGVMHSLGYSPEEVMGDPYALDRLIHPDDRSLLYEIAQNVETTKDPVLLRVVRRNGQISWQLLRVLPIVDSHGTVLGMEGFATDVTMMKQAEAELSHQARSDGLTGLANRLNFRESATRSLARLERHPGMMGVLYLDLDGFKTVNDTLGHAAGDTVLQEVAARLRKAIRREDVVARLGGDEFAVLLSELRNEGEAIATARRILDAVESPFFVDGRGAAVSTGVGIAVTTSGDMSPDELINRADIALYQAKRSGRGRWQVFDGANGSMLTSQGTLLSVAETSTVKTDPIARQPNLSEGALRAALAADDFRVHYLPEIDTQTGRITSMEALVRWQHPEFGLLPASAFINEVGATDVIHHLGDWVLREAAKQVLMWRARFDLPLQLWVNVSARQVGEPGFADSILTTLASVGFAPRDLGLDIPELALNGLEGHHDAALEALHRTGVRLAVDDFGLGATSLRTLRRLPVSQIKIDRSLIDDVDRIGGGDEALVQLAIKLAGSLGADVVAIGVERTGQLERLRALQCAFFQGFLAGEARTADEITQLLAQGQLSLPGMTLS
jgi:diguanylate cyclase (GGDEF)-like protein/PAS domain S-box-containing protein